MSGPALVLVVKVPEVPGYTAADYGDYQKALQLAADRKYSHPTRIELIVCRPSGVPTGGHIAPGPADP